MVLCYQLGLNLKYKMESFFFYHSPSTDHHISRGSLNGDVRMLPLFHFFRRKVPYILESVFFQHDFTGEKLSKSVICLGYHW